ncbi:radical SAM protein [Desulfovibrio sp. OttesenSCG-928-A18]|nr:radical SAM protein [Desulfovibrio sp. OttesenSCG-928-A18]
MTMRPSRYTPWKLLHQHDFLRALAKGERGAPVNIRLKPTNMCNHACSYCTYGNGDKENKISTRESFQRIDSIAETKLLEIADDIISMGVKAVTFSGGGEPLVHPASCQAARRLREGGVELALITNGQLLRGQAAESFAHARWVRVSLDSSDAQTYSLVRGVSPLAFAETLDNISSFSRIKSGDCVLGINYVVHPGNAARVYEAAGLIKELGVDNVKFSAMLTNERHAHDAIKADVMRQLDRAQRDLADDSFSIIAAYGDELRPGENTPATFTRCLVCAMITVIAADCKVYACMSQAYNPKALLCDLRAQSFKEAWFDPRTTARMAALTPATDCGPVCSYASRNSVLEHYLEVDQAHVNFI